MADDPELPGPETARRDPLVVDHERWLARFHSDAEALKDENLTTEPEAW